MKINIKATGIALTPAIFGYANKKISSLEKYLAGEAVAQVEVGKSTKHHKSGNVFRAEVHLVGGGLDLYAVSEKADLYAAIDVVKDEITHALTQNKTKKETLYRRGAATIKNMMKGLNIFKKRN
ncbi:MAG: ribosome-associated translation inhibitor RaiA [Candidatus Zambryskibacteria bacterium]|nr:ribosome-associated translation inhibitor RaiA [Candidatus Zambryskibacteria bacterium]